MREKQTSKVLLSLPASVTETIDKAASRKLQSRSVYIREAVRLALERDGLSVIAA
jgi:metal-responsive CopG/Arc/MetJ family transcriptional regulator